MTVPNIKIAKIGVPRFLSTLPKKLRPKTCSRPREKRIRVFILKDAIATLNVALTPHKSIKTANHLPMYFLANKSVAESTAYKVLALL